VNITIEDDELHYSPASASLIIQTEPAAIDHFVEALKCVNRERSGSAALSASFDDRSTSPPLHSKRSRG
jgi:hypothetical protein